MWEVIRESYFVVLPIITTGFMGWIGTQLNKQQKERSANSRGTMLILRYMLERYHTEFMYQGYITEVDYHNVEDIYNAYHELGGNGCATAMWEDIKRLPLRTDIKESRSPYAALLFNLYSKDDKQK